MKPRNRRLVFIAVGLVVLGAATALVLNALQSNLVFFFTPTQVAADAAPRNGAFRIGGSKPVVADPTVACDSVCKAIMTVANAVRSMQVNLIGLDLAKLFWKPMGQQVVGALISHLRKQKVSVEGTKVLMRDLEEYTHVSYRAT